MTLDLPARQATEFDYGTEWGEHDSAPDSTSTWSAPQPSTRKPWAVDPTTSSTS